jgi:inhibitor of KinA
VVAPGSVAIANDQTVIYPYAIAGGWSIIGCTPLRLFDAERQEPSLLAPGDRVRFKPITRREFEQIAESRAAK